jgi:hypothetical protein
MRTLRAHSRGLRDATPTPARWVWSLRAEAELYRHRAAPLGAGTNRDLAAEHKALADAASARDAEQLNKHITCTTASVSTG